MNTFSSRRLADALNDVLSNPNPVQLMHYTLK